MHGPKLAGPAIEPDGNIVISQQFEHPNRETYRATLDSLYAAEIRYVEAGGAAGGASFDEMAAHLHPEVTLHQGPSVPFPGDWKGADGVERFFAAFSETFQSLDLSEIKYFVSDFGLVIRLRMKAVARATGNPVDAEVAHTIVFEDGLMRDWTVFYLDPVTVTATTRP